MKTTLRTSARRGFTLIELMVVIAILMSLMGISAFVVLQHKNDGEITKTVNNIKSLGQELENFKSDRKSYPCDRTADKLTDDNEGVDYGDLKGDNANCYLRQVLLNNTGVDEKVFYAFNSEGLFTESATNEMANGEALVGGENGFSYVMHYDETDKSKKLPVRYKDVLLIASMGSDTPCSGEKIPFDADSYKEKAIIYIAGSGSATQLQIRRDANDDSIGYLEDNTVIFEKSKRGNTRSKLQDVVVLPPLPQAQ